MTSSCSNNLIATCIFGCNERLKFSLTNPVTSLKCKPSELILHKAQQEKIRTILYTSNAQRTPHRSPWWRHQMETFSVLLALWAGKSPVTGEFPSQRPGTRSFYVFVDLRLNKSHRAHYDVIVMHPGGAIERTLLRWKMYASGTRRDGTDIVKHTNLGIIDDNRMIYHNQSSLSPRQK